MGKVNPKSSYFLGVKTMLSEMVSNGVLRYPWINGLVGKIWVMENNNYPLVICYIAIENGPVEIVSCPINSMVDLSSSLR